MNSSGRTIRYLKELIVIALVLSIFAMYKYVPPATKLMDLALDPAVSGLTVLYSQFSTYVYQKTGWDWGFIQSKANPDFIYHVQLATFVNEKQATPLLDFAADAQLSREKREQALTSILKFESTDDWVQSYLNELPKGGLLDMYNEETPYLDELAKKIRLEGGLRNNLVRAYAEVVFGFMLQVPDAIVRRHSLRWVTDILPEEAIYLIAKRLDKETDPAVQKSLEESLLHVNAVADPQTAIPELILHYRKPLWPELRTPVAIVLSRLGHPTAVEHVRAAMKSQSNSKEEMVALRLAAARTRYPTYTKTKPKQSPQMKLLAQRREAQRKTAWAKHVNHLREERAEQIEMARRAAEVRRVASLPKPTPTPTQPLAPAEPPVVKEKPTPPLVILAKKEERPVEVRKSPAVTPPLEKTEVNDMNTNKPPSAEQDTIVVKEVESNAVVEAPQPKKMEVKPVDVPTPTPAPTPKKEESPSPKPTPEPKKEPPKPVTIPSSDMVTGADAYADLAVLATEDLMDSSAFNLPSAFVEPELPTISEQERPPKSLMNYVDVVFEVNENKVPVYTEAGSKTKAGFSLQKGNKGKADLEMMLEDTLWYQIKTKEGKGWVKGKSLTIYNIDDGSTREEPPTNLPYLAPREEKTFFEPTSDKVTVYAKPGDKKSKVSTLTSEVAYTAQKSEKQGGERWFLLEISPQESGWVKGSELRFADVQKPGPMGVTIPDQKSGFEAQWVSPAVRGVGIYSQPLISAEIIKQVSPPAKFKAIEFKMGNGKDWYKLELGNKKFGWVQTTDVNLVKQK